MKPYVFQPVVRARYQPSHSPVRFHWSGTNPVSVKATTPGANVIRKENGFELRLAVPGVPKDHIKIEVIEDQLVIAATNSNQETAERFIRQEFDYKAFKRSFALHKNADTDNMKASFDQGVLTIVIPDKQPATKKIDIV